MSLRTAAFLAAIRPLEQRNLHLRSYRPKSVRLKLSATVGICATMRLIPSRGPAHDVTVEHRHRWTVMTRQFFNAYMIGVRKPRLHGGVQ
jgi:hypothetical protein